MEALEVAEYPECEFEDVARNLGIYSMWRDFYKDFIKKFFNMWAVFNDVDDFNFEI